MMPFTYPNPVGGRRSRRRLGHAQPVERPLGRAVRVGASGIALRGRGTLRRGPLRRDPSRSFAARQPRAGNLFRHARPRRRRADRRAFRPDDETAAVKAVQAGRRTIWSKARSTTICWCAPSAMPSSADRAASRRRRPCATLPRSSGPPRKSSSGSIRSARPSLPGFDIAGALFPAKDTAGDYFDYIPMLDGSPGRSWWATSAATAWARPC